MEHAHPSRPGNRRVPRPGIFLDRDGVLCENRATYVRSWNEFCWLPGALEGLRILGRLGLPVIVVTNQSAINRGLATSAEVQDIHARMSADIRQAGGCVDAIYVCPHRPDEHCDCRKPGQSPFRQAAIEWAVDLSNSYLVGDNPADLEVGWDLQMFVILVRTGLGRETEFGLGDQQENLLVVRDFLAAARQIHCREMSRQARTDRGVGWSLGRGGSR